jgi:hypothetical protein
MSILLRILVITDCTKKPSDLIGDISLTKDKLIAEQYTDNELKMLGQKALTLVEAQTVTLGI